jgi:hypothetical protein
MDNVILGFDVNAQEIPLSQIYPAREVDKDAKKRAKYKQIKSSIDEVGIIEPLIVFPQGRNQYIILDGHIRYDILKHEEMVSAPCLISTENEGYTYNKRVNRLTSIQEYKMIRKAIKSGVSQDRLAKALNLSIATVQKKQSILVNICPEAIEVLKNKQIGQKTFFLLKKMKSVRQIEVAELMMSMNNFTYSYCKALFIATSPDMLKEGEVKKIDGTQVNPEKMALMETELQQLEESYRMAEETYGEDMLNFTVAQKYVVKLLKNRQIKKYLNRHQNDIYLELQEIAQVHLK